MFYRDTITMIKHGPILGSGLGTFGSAFSQYRTFDFSMDFLRYTHNDYLQLIAEMGTVAGGLIILIYLILFGWEYLLCVRQLE
jgi:O-antigen ligase